MNAIAFPSQDRPNGPEARYGLILSGLNRTPGHLPLVNSTPAASNARRITASVSSLAYLPASIWAMVLRSTPTFSASSWMVQFSKARAALICADVIYKCHLALSIKYPFALRARTLNRSAID